MPIGVLVNGISIALGGLVGALVGNKLSLRFRQTMELIFGGCAMLIGISSIVLMENMPAVVFSVILGTAIGLAIHLGDLIRGGAGAMQRGISRFVKPPENGMDEEAFGTALVTVIVLFCASGTGIYGSMVSGISGDHTILLAKSILDFFTAIIFGATMGMVVSLIVAPQLAIFLALFYLARFILPLTTPTMINDFKAVGGLLIFVTGFRMAKIKEFPSAEMIPAMVLAMPVSWAWTTFILPLLG